jgi:hypothetical protein
MIGTLTDMLLCTHRDLYLSFSYQASLGDIQSLTFITTRKSQYPLLHDPAGEPQLAR